MSYPRPVNRVIIMFLLGCLFSPSAMYHWEQNGDSRFQSRQLLSDGWHWLTIEE